MMSSELVMSSFLFQNFSQFIYWRVDLSLFDQTGYQLASNSSYFKVNQPPRNGNCTVDQTSGLSLETKFTISCFNWIDVDGSVVNYEFYCIFIFYKKSEIEY